MVKGIPIVMVAFGTTTKALDTYKFMDSIFRKRFGDNEILWAYSSRMVRDRIKARKGLELKHPHQVLSELAVKQYEWVVVQSVHLIWGHEFHRMVEEVNKMSIRVSIGLPLLTDPKDYCDTAKALFRFVKHDEKIASIFVGHGTDHPSWTSYLALERAFRKRLGKNTFVGLVEGVPSREEVIDAVTSGGFKKAHLIPLMVVAGTHFREDLVWEEGSWKQALEQRGIPVTVEDKGIGYVKEIVEIFCTHIEEALDAIPF